MNRFAPASRPGLTATLLRMIAALFFAALAALTALTPAAAKDDFLEPEKAFQFSAKAVDDRTIEVAFDIADGYYMYREKFAFAAEPASVRFGPAQIPPGKIKFDETFQKDVESHRGRLRILLPVESADGAFTLKVTSQGCADAGLCYPPMESTAKLSMTVAGAPGAAAVATPALATTNTSAPGNAAPQGAVAAAESRIESVLAQRNLWLGLLLFFGLGVALTFTPCVLPMIPILSSIITGQGASLTKARGFALAAAYVAGMAIIYTGMGVAAGLAGEGLAAFLQKPAVLFSFAGLLVLLSLSMFGFYELQLPAFLRDRLDAMSSKQRGGQFVGVFIMGALSAVIVGPCVTAPLASTLVFIAQSKDAVFGGAMLFAMALGMGVPLLLIGLGAGALLPRAGGWMEGVKRFFGVLILATALWMINPVIPSWLEMLGWATLLIVSAVYLRVFDPLPEAASGWRRLFKGVGVVLLAAGALQLIGLASGGREVLQPLAHLRGAAAAPPATSGAPTAPQAAAGRSIKDEFARVKTTDELDAAIAMASALGKPVLLDFWAEWCVSCKEMEKFTFTDPAVAAKMREFTLLQVDVTANNADDRALLKRFGLFGPPGIIFFAKDGQEIQGSRVIGFQNAERFLGSLQRAS
ncbi:protein-disulfide reductase DsbD [Piscinibacterium candidicorallinum]|uniref:Thiol:disulfide interchange protein DsbD n=1 Tax=Piscinibacterium candidicorallinum TaxID=1793872 RepID=A0ABV7H655_9BURK